jgi:hypothetical protein
MKMSAGSMLTTNMIFSLASTGAHLDLDGMRSDAVYPAEQSLDKTR